MTDEETRALNAQVVALSREHGDVVYGIVRRYARSEDDLDDLLQNVWLRVVEILPARNPESPVHLWLAAVALNVCREWSRGRQRWKMLQQSVMGFLTGAQSPEQEDFVDPGVAARVWDAIDRLPDLQRRVLVHRHVEGLSTAETAEAIDRAEGTVKASLHRAIARLREELADLAPFWRSDDI